MTVTWLFLYLFCFSFLLSCSGNKNSDFSGNHKVVVKDENGNLKHEISYLNDTLKHGRAKYYYYPTNIPKCEMNFNYGKKEGWQKYFREDGTLKSKTHFRENIQDGLTYWYFEDGKTVKEKSNWKKGKPYGDAFYYYRNGSLETFNSDDAFGDTFFVIKWDSLGNKIYEDGMVFSPQFLSNLSASKIKTNEPLILRITVANPPNTKSRIFMEIKGKTLQELDVIDNTAIFNTSFTSPGLYNLITVGELKDLQGKLINRDSITTEIEIID